MSLSVEANERLYDTLAAAIDRAGPAQESLYLTKLALLLANQLGDEAEINLSITAAFDQLPTVDPTGR